MADLKHARLLLEMARKDYRALMGMADSSIFADEIFGFHVQQAAEKAAKAWLALRGSEVPRTHSLGTLLAVLGESGESVEPYWRLVEFQIFAVQYRYETISQAADAIDRADAVRAIEELLVKVERVEREFL